MIQTHADGTISWDKEDFSCYVITGKDTSGRRFKLTYESWDAAACINLWNGNKWGIKPDGKRVLLQTVRN